MSMTLDTAIVDVMPPERDKWLAQCYVETEALSTLLDARSCLVFGKHGYGKTALAQLVQRITLDKWFHVQIVTNQISADAGLFNAIADRLYDPLWRRIKQSPALLNRFGARLYTLKSLLRRYYKLGLDTELEELLESHPEERESIGQFIDLQDRDEFNDELDVLIRVGRLVACVRRLALDGVFIWLDIPQIDQVEAESLADSLMSIFDSKGWTRLDSLHFKCLAQPELGDRLLRSYGVQEGSVEVTHLRWKPSQLQTLVDQRLALATAGRLRDFTQILDFSECMNFLKLYSDDQSPLEWRHLLAAAAEHVSAQNPASALDSEAWAQVRRCYLQTRVKLRVVAGHDQESGEVYLGNQIKFDSGKRELFKLVKYLYDHPGEHEKDKLARALNTMPETLETSISRARKLIEPDLGTSRQPIFLQSHGRLYTLQNTDRAA